MITYEVSLSCDCPGCENGFSSEQKATPFDGEFEVRSLAADRGWVYELGAWMCPGCQVPENRPAAKRARALENFTQQNGPPFDGPSVKPTQR